jgi:putative addiction module component (TIGR02574 family)
MTAKAERLLEEALKLPQGTRARLAGRLILSLDEERDKDVEAAWAAEVDRRLENFDVSRAKALPWVKVKRSILRSRRGRK